MRDFVLQRTQSIEVKKDAFGLLKYMGAQEPYLSYVDGELMESRVSLVAEMPEDVPAAYSEVLERCVGSMKNVRPDACLQAAAEIWGTFTTGLSGYPPLSGQQSVAPVGGRWNIWRATAKASPPPKRRSAASTPSPFCGSTGPCPNSRESNRRKRMKWIATM